MIFFFFNVFINMVLFCFSFIQTYNEYFVQNLRTNHLGRLVIYTEVLTTSMHLIHGPPLAHGLAVIPCRQTTGVGRFLCRLISCYFYDSILLFF